MAAEKATVRLRGGASLVKCCPTFSWDSKYLFCCSGDTVKVLSINSGECVRNLRGHQSPVTCVQVNPKNKLQIFSSALDQTIVKWNYTDGVKLQTYQLRSPVIMFWPLGNPDNSVITLHKTRAEGCEVSRCKLDKKESIKHKTLIGRCSTDVRCVAMGTENEYVVSVQGKKMKIYSLKKEMFVEHFLDRDKFTCVTCHPTEYCIATGCSGGKIYFWWNFLSTKKVVKTICHWHALPVLHLTFTAEGSYLLSGGYECVLVKWQYNSHHRDFLPRLGAPIRFVACSPDNTLYVTAHSHNVIQVLSNTFNLVQVYQGLTRSHREGADTDPIPVGFLVDPTTGALVTNGQPGHLQFYCLHTDKQLYSLDIVCQNYISPIDLKKPTVVTEVRQAAFDNQGEWLVTLEMWDDGVMTPEIRLKFWEFNKQSQNFVLNTRVETAHEKKVNSVKFRPTSTTELSPMVVTTSDDGHFRLWSLVDDTDIYRSRSRWSCESVGFYRDLPAGRAAFSEDGSLLAVTFTSTLTLWDPDTNGLRTSLRRHADNDDIRQVEFGLRQSSHLLVSCSQKTITVWNLLTCTVLWSVRLEVVAMARDMNSDIMAVFTKSRDVFAFRPSHSSPVYTQGSVSHSDIIGAVFIPNSVESSSKGEKSLPWEEKSQLYFMNKDQLLLTVTADEEATTERESATPVPQNLPQTPMRLLMAESRKSGVKEDRPALLEGHLGQPGTQFVKQMLTTAAHVLPPVTSLCGSFLQSVLAPNSSKEDLEDSDSDTKPAQDESSDSESDMETDDKTVPKQSRYSANARKSQETKTSAESSSYLDKAFDEDSISNCEMENFSWLESVL